MYYQVKILRKFINAKCNSKDNIYISNSCSTICHSSYCQTYFFCKFDDILYFTISSLYLPQLLYKFTQVKENIFVIIDRGIFLHERDFCSCHKDFGSNCQTFNEKFLNIQLKLYPKYKLVNNTKTLFISNLTRHISGFKLLGLWLTLKAHWNYPTETF